MLTRFGAALAAGLSLITLPAVAQSPAAQKASGGSFADLSSYVCAYDISYNRNQKIDVHAFINFLHDPVTKTILQFPTVIQFRSYGKDIGVSFEGTRKVPGVPQSLVNAALQNLKRAKTKDTQDCVTAAINGEATLRIGKEYFSQGKKPAGSRDTLRDVQKAPQVIEYRF